MRPPDHPRSLLARVREQLDLPPGRGRISRQDVWLLVALVERHLRVAPYLRHDPGCDGGGRLGRPSQCTCGLSRAARLDDEPR